MISVASIGTIFLRYVRMTRKDINFILFSLYWPLLDILIWGFLGTWIQQSMPSHFQNYETTALLGILLWQVASRGCNLMVMTLLEELWANNLVVLFSLPIHVVEWMGGIILFNILMVGITTLVSFLVIFFLYKISIATLLYTFLLFFPPLLFSSIWLGFTCLQIIIMLGKRGIELGFVFGWFFSPFSGAFYPIEVLPQWAQAISAFLPMSYVFSGMRAYVMHQEDPTSYLIKGYIMSIVYALCALALFVYFFNRSKEKGLARLAE